VTALSRQSPTEPLSDQAGLAQATPDASEVYWADTIGRRNTLDSGVAVAARRKTRRSDRAGRPPVGSAGRPTVYRPQELRSVVFQQGVATLGARYRFICAGRPRVNRWVERVQQTILEECWKRAFAHYLIPKQTRLRLNLERYVRYYNTERAHTGRWTKGRTPGEVLGKARLCTRGADTSPQLGDRTPRLRSDVARTARTSRRASRERRAFRSRTSPRPPP
jgi:hypothetical protein